MIKYLAELINCFTEVVQEIKDKTEIQPPQTLEDDLAELKPIDPRNYFSFEDDEEF